jgi:hypothetical protein
MRLPHDRCAMLTLKSTIVFLPLRLLWRTEE